MSEDSESEPEEEPSEPVDIWACEMCHPVLASSGHVGGRRDPCFVCHLAPDVKDVDEGVEHVPLEPTSNEHCASCHEPAEEASYQHPPEVQEDCIGCHAPHDASDNPMHLIERHEVDLCLSCHELDETRYTHTVVKRGRCTTCHVAHGSEQEYLLVGETPADACGTCHADESSPNAHDHRPAEEGDCDACHDPHGGDYRDNLIAPEKEVCYQCHRSKETTLEVHSAVVLGQCAGCHNPHGSENDRMLYSKPIAPTCHGCHYDDITGRNFIHKPVGEGHCTICHDSHATNFTRNLRTTVNLTCGMCHPDEYRPDAWYPHAAVVADGCPTCHDPHASDNDHGLRLPPMKLCLTCHPGYDDGAHVGTMATGIGHPMGKADDPLRKGEKLTCVSCHDPHGSNNPNLWYRGFQRMAVCVECHRKTLAPGTTPGASSFETQAEAARERERKRREAEAQQR